MKAPIFTYRRPDDLDGALALLANHAGEAQVLAGNDGMLKVFRRSGLPIREHLDDGVVFVEMDLAPVAGG